MDSVVFYGAAGEVGRSCFVVESHENTMLDCGLKLEGRTPVPPIFPLERATQLDQLVISHAHLDHCGYSPALYQAGFSGKTVITKPSRDLAQILLADALKLQGESLFSHKSVDKLFKHMKLFDFNKPSGGTEFRNAGHIIGSAMTLLDTQEHRILYTGDINLRSTRLLEGADTENLEADVLITEGTYGGQHIHPASKKTVSAFIGHIGETLKKGGKVLVPTFAVGRGQEVLLTLESHMRSGLLPRCPIFLDGMVTKALRIHRHNAVDLKREIQLRLLTSEDDPFKSEFYQEVKTRSKKEVFESEAAIIVATSGMLVGGPSVRYFQKLAEDEKNTVILVGYQANETPGRLLKEGAKKIIIGNKHVDVRCRVEVSPFTGHSDSRELVQLARSVKGLKQVFVVHSEAQKASEFARELSKKLGVKARVPQLGEKVNL
ncbi:MBL fold metallo-hydrolase [Candidatus Micrarchaeota archaeon]|nr:MBL fold metallo-hydrolase [Candidatus Micrarchaeota archaeon]